MRRVAMWDPRGGSACPAGEADPSQLSGTQMGKRYADEQAGLELLCTKPGKGTIAVNGVPLPLVGSRAAAACGLAGCRKSLSPALRTLMRGRCCSRLRRFRALVSL